jgi:2-keto-4-pentenoate hydratase/2-oxohepta-3-ene-1,7-dioic acid hydratase in catechol pathway
MKIARFNGGRIGLVIDGAIRDVTAAAGVDPAEWPPVGPVRLIAEFAARRDALLKAAQNDAPIPLDQVTLDTPVPWPNKLIAYPVNYHDHATEMSSRGFANLQGFFLKANSSLSGPSDPILVPNVVGREVHHECEIALIIGKEGRQIAPENAFDYVFGYSCLLDMTVRGNEERAMRKSFDTFTPVGPWIVTADEIKDPTDMKMRLWVNGELRQQATTKDLIVDIPNMIAVASSSSTLYPGDIIATGTPAGVAKVVPGDTVTIEVDEVGKMSLPVVADTRGSSIVFSKPFEFKRAAV